jgi:protein TonB
MFEEAYIKDKQISLKRWSVPILLAILFYILLFSIVSAIKVRENVVNDEMKKIEVEFVEEVLKEPEPVKPAPPVIPKHLKVVKVEEPVAAPKVEPLAVPEEVPDTAPPEADPSQDKGVAVYGAYDPNTADPLGLEGGVSEPEPEPIRLPENAIPPKPLTGNVKPNYPLEAKRRGLTSTVLLKVIISTKGNVTKVEILRGEEPFASEAVKAVKNWKYTPAYYKNKPITVYRIIKIPFKLTA